MIKEAAKTNRDRKGGRAVAFSRLSAALISFLLALLISGASVDGNCCIAGVSFIAAHGARLHGLAALIGICVGYPVMFGLENTMHYIVSALFIYTIAYLLQYTRLYGYRYFMPFVTVFILALVRAFGSVTVIRPAEEDICAQLLELLTGGILTDLYAVTVSGRVKSNKPWQLYSVCTIISTLLMSLSKVHIAESISLSSLLAEFIYLIFIYNFPKQISFPISIMFGFALHLTLPIRTFILPHYILLSLSDVFAVKTSKSSISLFALCVSGLISICFGPSEITLIQIAESVIGVLLFIIFAGKPRNISNPQQCRDKEDRLNNLAILLRSIGGLTSDIPQSPAEAELNLTGVFDRAAEMVCTQCVNRTICWKTHMIDMVSILKEAEPRVLKRGKMLDEDLPEYFINQCSYPQSLVLAINYELLRAYEDQNRTYERQLIMYTMGRLFHCFSEMIELLSVPKSSDGIKRMTNEDWLQGEIGVASMKKGGEQVCGDSVRYFKTDDEMLYIILSDGIGTGKNAQMYSNLVVSILEESLLLFNDPMLAIELANTAMAVQWGTKWGYATIDIASVCLSAGEISIYKLGAADSFIVTKNETLVVEGNPLSAGIEGDWTQWISVYNQRIEPNSVLVMASDGAAIADASTLSGVIMSKQYSMKSAAKKLLLSISGDDSDDRTIVLLSLT